MNKLTTLSPEFIAEAAWAIEQVKRLVKGGLLPGELGTQRSADAYVAKTPVGGIEGRSETTIRAAMCEIYKEVRTSNITGSPKTLVAINGGSGSTKKLPVYNLYCEDVPGEIFVPTGLTKSGTRFVLEWSICDESSPPSDSSESSSDNSDSSIDSSSDSIPSQSLDSPSGEEIGTCETVPTCTWWGRLYEGGSYVWLAYSDLTMPQCNGIDPFPNIGCGCAEPDRAPAYDYEIVYTPCDMLT